MSAQDGGRHRAHLPLAVASALLLAVAVGTPANSARPQQMTSARGITATASGGSVKISGWATFSGSRIAAGTSKRGSAGPNGDRLGTDLTFAAIDYRPELGDLFIRWQVNKLPSTGNELGVNVVGAPGVLYGLSTTVANVPVEVRAQSFGTTQRFALYNCKGEGACGLAGSLAGGFGTIDEEVVVSVPLTTLAGFGLPLHEGDQIGTPIAWTAFPVAMDTPSPTPSQARVDTISTAKTPRVMIPAKSLTVSVGKTSAVAALHKGTFTAYLPRSVVPRNPATVITRTCLGGVCTNQSFSVRF